jgi:hypothetical protein
MTDRFIAYRGDPDLHDGTVLSVDRQLDQVRVVVTGASGRGYEITFSGVDSIVQHRTDGMLLHGLAEMSTDAPLRRFVFTNWNEDDDAKLEVFALDLDWKMLQSD